MKIIFKKQDPKLVISAIQENLSGRQLGKMVEFALGDGHKLDVYIRKMGTSQLSFDFQNKSNEMEWKLASEKIALTHRAFRGEVMEKLVKIVGQVGGQVQDS